MRKHWIMLTISFICIVVFPLGWIAQTLISERGNPQAAGGSLDLTQWDFDRKGAASLKGVWDFYPGQLLSPADIEASVSVFLLNLSWQEAERTVRAIAGYRSSGVAYVQTSGYL
ncbi:hypothetical protein [Paenibacillus sp.]